MSQDKCFDSEHQLPCSIAHLHHHSTFKTTATTDIMDKMGLVFTLLQRENTEPQLNESVC